MKTSQVLWQATLAILSLSGDKLNVRQISQVKEEFFLSDSGHCQQLAEKRRERVEND